MHQLAPALSPDRQRFLEERRHGIGGSDAAAVLGESSWRGPLEVYLEKIGELAPDEREEDHLELGTLLEPFVARKYAKASGAKVLPGRFVTHPDRPWQRAHLDGLVVEHPEREGEGSLQIKTAGWERDEWSDGPPLEYQIQVQHEMLAAGKRWAVLAVLFGAPVHHVEFFELELHAGFSKALTEREAAFWQAVQERRRPVPNAHDGKAIAQLYPRELVESVQLPPEALEWDEELVRVKAELKRLKEREAELGNLLRVEIGDAGLGRLPGSDTFYTLRTVEETVVEAHTRKAYRPLKRGVFKPSGRGGRRGGAQ